MVAEHVVETSHVGNGTVEIPQLQNVDSELRPVSEYEKLKQFRGDETKTELGAEVESSRVKSSHITEVTGKK